MDKLDIETYLSRIEYAGPVEATEQVLEKLCWCHVTHVPFFTLDLFGGKADKKEMNPATIYKKIVTDKGGGLCYELNGLFSILLKSIGFKVDVIRTEALINERYGGSLVTLIDGQKRIADVSCLALPLKFDRNEPQYQRNTKARAVKRWCEEKSAWYIYVEKLERIAIEDNNQIATVQKPVEPAWRGRFRFRPDAGNVELSEFQPNLDATVRTEGSVFTTTSFCVLQTERGIKALVCYKYVEKEFVDDFTDIRRTHSVKDLHEFKRILRDTFNVVLHYDPLIPNIDDATY